MLDTPLVVKSRLQLYSGVSDRLARDMVQNSFRDLAERRRWSWLMKAGEFVTPGLTNSGTVSVTRGLNIVTGTNTTWDTSLVGQQFRVALGSPIYDITQVLSPTQLILSLPYGDSTVATSGYLIYQCFFPVPDDFHAFWVFVDPRYNWQLMTDVGQDQIDVWDAQRSNIGQAYVVSFRDYTASYNGVTSTPLVIAGTNAPPMISPQTSFSGPADATFTIRITTGGTITSGNLALTYQKNAQPVSSILFPDSSGYIPLLLQDNLYIYFSPAVTYTTGDTFVIPCQAVTNPGVPRYELWPHQIAQYQYQFLYERRTDDVYDRGFVLPRYIRGDVLLEMALAKIAAWPGTADDPNPYFNPKIIDRHEARSERMILDLERQDEEVFMQDMRYQTWSNYPWLPLGDSNWLASHAI